MPQDSVMTFYIAGLASYIEMNVNHKGDLICVGDFNILYHVPYDLDTLLLTRVMESFNLSNVVDFLVHHSLHTLDLVLRHGFKYYQRGKQRTHTTRPQLP